MSWDRLGERELEELMQLTVGALRLIAPPATAWQRTGTTLELRGPGDRHVALWVGHASFYIVDMRYGLPVIQVPVSAGSEVLTLGDWLLETSQVAARHAVYLLRFGTAFPSAVDLLAVLSDSRVEQDRA